MRQEDGSYVCPQGYKFEFVRETINTKGQYKKVNQILENVNVNIKFTKSVSLIFTSSGCYDHHPQSWISYPLFDMTFL